MAKFAEELARYRKASRMARDLGMPPPRRPTPPPGRKSRAPRSRAPRGIEATRRAVTKRRQQLERMASALFTPVAAGGKLITGAPGSIPARGSGILEFGRMPGQLREKVRGFEGAPIGWDVAKLLPEERQLLGRFVGMTQLSSEEDARREARAVAEARRKL